MKRYKIVRSYFVGHPREIVQTGLTLEEAQEWCRDPETSSSTATGDAEVKRTEEMGAWFDGYDEE